MQTCQSTRTGGNLILPDLSTCFVFANVTKVKVHTPNCTYFHHTWALPDVGPTRRGSHQMWVPPDVSPYRQPHNTSNRRSTEFRVETSERLHF